MLISVRKNGDKGPRVLVLAPDTPGLPDLEATADGGELAFMGEELRGVHVDALIGTVGLTGKSSLSDALRDGAYTTLHLITHGDCEHAQLSKEAVSWEAVARLLSQHQVGLVVAMMCDSREFALGLVRAGLPQVIATTGRILNGDARVFAREFYGCWAEGKSVAEATAYARSRMKPEAAALIALLPDELAATDEDPVLAELRKMARETAAWRQEVREWCDKTTATMDTMTRQHSLDMRNLATAMTKLAEVLSR